MAGQQLLKGQSARAGQITHGLCLTQLAIAIERADKFLAAQPGQIDILLAQLGRYAVGDFNFKLHSHTGLVLLRAAYHERMPVSNGASDGSKMNKSPLELAEDNLKVLVQVH